MNEQEFNTFGLELAASLGYEVSVGDNLPRAFPGQALDHYGFAETFWALSNVSAAIVRRIQSRFGTMDAFWDAWQNYPEGENVRAVAVYDLAMVVMNLLPNVADNGEDVIMSYGASQWDVFADKVLDAFFPPADLPNHINSILTPT